MKNSIWKNRNFSLLICATVLGAVGGVTSGYALALLVFDETGSTLASALVLAIKIIPGFLLPLVVSPWLDRLPRKPFLVAGDALNGLVYGLMGLWLLSKPFSYPGYLAVSLLLSMLNTVDSMAYHALYPNVIPKGQEQQGYSVASMLYPTVMIVMMPLSAVLYDGVGVAAMLMIQGVLSLLAALVESRVRVAEPVRGEKQRFSFALWWGDLKDAFAWLRREKGIFAIYSYGAFTNGVATGYSPMLLAFFRTAPGLTMAMYSFFSVVEFIGRSIGGVVSYRLKIAPNKKFGFVFLVYQIYECMDMLLLWLPYPLMLINRSICGFLGVNSAAMREAAVQTYIPDELRAKVTAFESMLISLDGFVLTLVMGALGECFSYGVCVSLFAALSLLWCWCTVWRQRKAIRRVYEQDGSALP